MAQEISDEIISKLRKINVFRAKCLHIQCRDKRPKLFTAVYKKDIYELCEKHYIKYHINTQSPPCKKQKTLNEVRKSQLLKQCFKEVKDQCRIKQTVYVCNQCYNSYTEMQGSSSSEAIEFPPVFVNLTKYRLEKHFEKHFENKHGTNL